MDNQRKHSTSYLAKSCGMSTKALFDTFQQAGWIVRESDKWVLTETGRSKGGDYDTSPKFGEYIVWPDSVSIELGISAEDDEAGSGELLSATALGKALGFSAQRVNRLLSELGWVEKALKGWKLSDPGKRLGGVQREHSRTGVPFVVWPKSVLANSSLVQLIRELEEGSTGDREEAAEEVPTAEATSTFRDKFKAKLRATDGHFVRSRAEMLIDNWLYMAEVVHAYERKLPIEEEVYCDFYIPSGKIYIEYWGYENDAKYLQRKAKKQEIYAKHGFKLIELEDKDIENLDDVLPRMLLKFGVETS